MTFERLELMLELGRRDDGRWWEAYYAIGLDGVGLAKALGDAEFSDESPLAAWLDKA